MTYRLSPKLLRETFIPLKNLYREKCHFISWRCYLGKVESLTKLVTQSCPTLCNPTDCSLSGSSVHGIFQARILMWVAIPFSRRSSWPRDRTWVSHIAGRFFTVWATREAHCPYTQRHITEAWPMRVIYLIAQEKTKLMAGDKIPRIQCPVRLAWVTGFL